MKEHVIQKLEEGQRLDKFLHKYLKAAPSSFLYKMLRKKNIVLNGKKALGSEMLSEKDIVSFYLSEETMNKFRDSSKNDFSIKEYESAYLHLSGMSVLLETDDFLFLNKPAGILSQKANSDDISANEWGIGYLLKEGKITPTALGTFKPSVCNRLDRNTCGILIFSKTLKGSQEIGKLLKERTVHKFYRCIVEGEVLLDGTYEAFLYKNEAQNKVTIKDCIEAFPISQRQKTKPIKTGIRTIQTKNGFSELEIELFTGKSHQIRAQLAFLGHPIAGDFKYGAKTKDRKEWNRANNEEGQILCAYRLVFPKMKDSFNDLSNKEIVCPRPDIFLQLMG